MKLREAIRETYGNRLSAIPEDGVFRKFRIDPFRIGFVCNLGDCAFFGCRADRVVYAWNEQEVTKINLAEHNSEKIRFELYVVAIAKGLIERGDILNHEDSERLELAVQRLSDS